MLIDYVKKDCSVIRMSYWTFVGIRVMNALIIVAFLQFIFIFVVFVFFKQGVLFHEPNPIIAIIELILSLLLIPCVIWRLKQ